MPLYRLLVLLSWFAPGLLAVAMFVVSSWVPDLTAPIGTMPSQVGTIWIGIFAAVALVWVIFGEVMPAADLRETARELQLDDTVGLLWTVIFTWMAGWSFARGTMSWALLIPWIESLIDAFVSGWLAINNAAQKPLMQAR